MALRKPLVMVNGKIQQIDDADTLSAAVAEQEIVSLTADASIAAGQVVYLSAADHVNLAKADAVGTVKAVGMATAAISSSASGSVKTSGVITLTTTQWDAITGATGGLVFNTDYYLSPTTAGMITATAPTTAGQYVVMVGRAISTTELKIMISDYILL